MAKLSNNTVLDVVGKQGLGVSSTNNDKNYYEELYSWRPQLTGDDIFTDIVPNADNPSEADDNVINNPTILEKLTDYTLTELPSSNGQGYGIFTTPGDTSSDRLYDFLTPQKFGNGYACILKNNTTIIPLSAGQFTVDYANGIIRFDVASTPSFMGWSNLNITIYRYIGETGGGTSGGEGFNMTFTNSNLVNGVLSVPHGLGAIYNVIHIAIRDNLNDNIYPDGVNFIDNDNASLDFSSFSPISGTWALTVGIGGGSGGTPPIIDPLQIDGETKTPLSGSFQWLNNTISGLPTSHDIEIGEKVVAGYTLPSVLWVNTELSENGGVEFILIPETGNITDYIVTGQEFIVTGSTANGNIYSIGSGIYLNGSAIANYHVAEIVFVSGTPVSLPTYPTIEVPTSVDRVGGAQNVEIECLVESVMPTSIDIDESTQTTINITSINIYCKHYIKHGNFGIGKDNPDYLLDVDGTCKLKNIISDNIIVEFPESEPIDNGELVFFGSDKDKNLITSKDYYKGFDETSLNFDDLSTNSVLTGGTVLYGSDIVVEFLQYPSAVDSLRAYTIDIDGTNLGTPFEIGNSTGAKVFPLRYNSNDDNRTIEDGDKEFGVVNVMSASSGQLYLGYYRCNTDLTITQLKIYDYSISLGANWELQTVIPITHKILTNTTIRYFVIVVKDPSNNSWIKFCSYDPATDTEIIGDNIDIGIQYDPNNNIFAHYRVSPNTFRLMFQTSSGIMLMNIDINPTTYNMINPPVIEYVFGQPTGKLMYVDFDDTYIGTDSFDIIAVQYNVGSVSIFDIHWKGGLVSALEYNMLDKSCYYHGVNYFNCRRMGLTNKIVLYGHHTDRAVGIVDVKDKTYKVVGLFGNWDYMNETESQNCVRVLSDKILYIESYDSYKFVKFYDNAVGLCVSNINNQIQVIFGGKYTSTTPRYDVGSNISLGPVPLLGMGGSTLGFSNKYSCGINLATPISSTEILFNPSINTISSSNTLKLDKHSTFREQQSSGVDGGTFTSGSWVTRTLNNMDSNIGAVLSGNQFTLPKGKYSINASAPAYMVDKHQIQLFNVDSGVVSILGTTETSVNGAYAQNRSFISGVIDIINPTTFEIQHRCETTVANNGLGIGVSWGDNVFTIVEIERLGD